MALGWIGLIGEYEEQRVPRNSLRNEKDPCILLEVRKRRGSLHWRHDACSGEEGEHDSRILQVLMRRVKKVRLPSGHICRTYFETAVFHWG